MDENGGSVATSSRAAQAPVWLDETLEALRARVDCSAVELADANKEIDGLREALRTRTLIGQAIGILMAQEGLSTDEAFARLVETSSHSNLKLRDVAARMVELADAGATSRQDLSSMAPRPRPHSIETSNRTRREGEAVVQRLLS
jgi:ANTAR domain